MVHPIRNSAKLENLGQIRHPLAIYCVYGLPGSKSRETRKSRIIFVVFSLNSASGASRCLGRRVTGPRRKRKSEERRWRNESHRKCPHRKRRAPSTAKVFAHWKGKRFSKWRGGIKAARSKRSRWSDTAAHNGRVRGLSPPRFLDYRGNSESCLSLSPRTWRSMKARGARARPAEPARILFLSVSARFSRLSLSRNDKSSRPWENPVRALRRYLSRADPDAFQWPRRGSTGLTSVSLLDPASNDSTCPELVESSRCLASLSRVSSRCARRKGT